MCMAEMYSRAGEEYAVAHCNFHLRGGESDADAAFVERWAEEHGVQFFRADFDTAAYASEHGISIEMAARELRYAWFWQTAVRHGFDAVAVAHNANDNAETLILNLLRGTGLRGLRGMASDVPSPEGKVRLLRPILGMTREEIEKYAEENGVEYREDRTNADVEYKRNRIRNAVFPEFRQINPAFVRTLNQDMERFAQADDIAEDYFREAEGKVFAEGRISVPALLSFKHWKYVLFRILEPFGFHTDTLAAAVRLLEEHAAGRASSFGGKRFLSPTHVLETSRDAMTLRDRESEDNGPDELAVTGPGDYPFHGRTVRIEYADPGSMKQEDGLLYCDARSLPFPFILRGWQAGDWMRPFGMSGRAKKLSDLFTDRKMSLSEKDASIVVYSPSLDSDSDGRVAAVAALRMDEALRVTKGSVKVLRISLL